jgi:ferredoxin
LKSEIKPALVEIKTEARSAPDYRRRALLGKSLLVLVGGLAAEKLWASTEQNAVADEQAARDAGMDDNRQKRRAIRPPGFVSAVRFSDHCTACQLCVSACPSHVLQPSSLEFGVANLLKPQMNFNDSYCSYDCNRCGEVCPSGAIQALSQPEKKRTRVGLAKVNQSHCLVNTRQAACTICIRRCPTKAIETIPFGNNLHMPKVNVLLCIGCGRCEYECPAEPERAIKVTGLLRETQVPVNALGTSHL